MKNIKLLSLLLAAVFAAGCAGTGSQSGSQSAGSQKAAASSDAEISSKVKAALAADPELSGTKIDATTTDGVVRLKGEIKSMALRKKVESIVRGVSGVKSIDNQLIITG
ncbi:MAG TPA: BON domain-containing protein [Noviherbaspirillum sp.]|jgi:osmotically-inducible protein OsmY|uniref:BON domain-containing protein n=1 Tax=Noviherbaspirillum sp. TaxID=1926288 RepID=UPI002DDD7E51|nr:BON domain-containing protein [Noviherbaspirillum sp.]HEV2609247.1 BON domain-containing protein [Noviherbaspirillum sp.]